jgi:hypothetical protein
METMDQALKHALVPQNFHRQSSLRSTVQLHQLLDQAGWQMQLLRPIVALIQAAPAAAQW